MARKISPMSRKQPQAERAVSMRVTVLYPPPGVAMCLRSKDDDIVDRVISGASDLTFEFMVRAKRVDGSDAPRLLGLFVYGPPAQRFVYIRVGTLAGQPGSCWSRAAKIPLSGISWTMIEQAGRGGGRLEVKVSGRTKRGGGPFCATVPLLDGGWRVAD